MENELINSRASNSGCFWATGSDSPSFCLETCLEHMLENSQAPFKIRLASISSEEPSSPHSQHDCLAATHNILIYNRKQKSLAQLTKKFIQKFEGAATCQLVLDQISLELSVERRRIYDIINIMESLHVVSKIRKNIYLWKGLSQAVITIQQLDFYSSPVGLKPKKQRSLQSLSTEFLKIFTKAERGLTLEQAADLMKSDEFDQGKKTRVRRLYDIVNAFKCLGLVRRVKILGSKASYQWMGCEELKKIIQQKHLLHSQEDRHQLNGTNESVLIAGLEGSKMKGSVESKPSQEEMVNEMEIKQEIQIEKGERYFENSGIEVTIDRKTNKQSTSKTSYTFQSPTPSPTRFLQKQQSSSQFQKCDKKLPSSPKKSSKKSIKIKLQPQYSSGGSFLSEVVNRFRVCSPEELQNMISENLWPGKYADANTRTGLEKEKEKEKERKGGFESVKK